jgi:hypothetical protein
METKEIQSKLLAPFPSAAVKWKPQSVKGNRAMALAYIDARLVEDRLDAVVGVTGWQDEYELLPDGSVMCRLRLKIDGEWIVKMDVGSQSEQPDGGDRIKAAFSDALKRTAVKFGIGRYLYRLSNQWCDYDAVKRAFVKTPPLPYWAIPEEEKNKPVQRHPQPKTQPQPQPASTPPAANGIDVKHIMQQFKECETNEQYQVLIKLMGTIKDKISESELAHFREEAKRLSAKFGSAK